MEIFIKSLNRPYFLDRCISSLKSCVKGYSRIIILDDGTPQKYLDRLMFLHPEIEIRKSEFYSLKSELIAEGRPDRKKFVFPGAFWGREVMNAKGEYILILEDDMFFTESIDLQYIEKQMQSENLQLFKMMWQNNPSLVFGRQEKLSGFRILYPELLTTNGFVFGTITDNRFKILSLLAKIGIWNYFYKKYIVKYYSIYTVAGAIFNKNYFTFLWSDIKNLDETRQIQKTLFYYKENDLRFRIGISDTEILKTSLISSATNEFKEINFSVFHFNKAINELWLDGKVDVLNNYPLDWKEEYVKKLLSQIGWQETQILQWEHYKAKFVDIYKKIGSII